MSRRPAGPLVLFALGVVYAASLGVASIASIRASWAGGSRDASRIVLSPLSPSDPEQSRTVDTRVDGMRVRRLCSDGRCELLAGEGDRKSVV